LAYCSTILSVYYILGELSVPGHFYETAPISRDSPTEHFVNIDVQWYILAI